MLAAAAHVSNRPEERSDDHGGLCGACEVPFGAGDEGMGLGEIGGDIADRTRVGRLDVGACAFVLLETECEGSHHTEIEQIRLNGHPHVDVALDGVHVGHQAFGHGQRHHIGMEEHEGSHADHSLASASAAFLGNGG